MVVALFGQVTVAAMFGLELLKPPSNLLISGMPSVESASVDSAGIKTRNRPFGIAFTVVNLTVKLEEAVEITSSPVSASPAAKTGLT